MKLKRTLASAAPRAVLVLLTAATFALFTSLARADLASARLELSREGRSGAILASGAQMSAMLGGSAALFCAYIAEGIAFVLILDRVTRGGAGEFFSPGLFAFLACAFTAAYFYAMMTV